MSGKKVVDMPEGRYKEILKDAESRGSEIESSLTNGNSVVIIGLCEIIDDMKREIEVLKNEKT